MNKTHSTPTPFAYVLLVWMLALGYLLGETTGLVMGAALWSSLMLATLGTRGRV